MTRAMLALWAALALALAFVPAVDAAPPAGFTCIGGYNPSALSNVCYKITSGSYTLYPGTVTAPTQEVCVIGNLCEDIPVPQYNPSGGSPITVPLVGVELYHEVLGTPILKECPAHEGGQGVYVATEVGCLYSDGPEICLSVLEGPERLCVFREESYEASETCLRFYQDEYGSYTTLACYTTEAASSSQCLVSWVEVAVGLCMYRWDGRDCFKVVGAVDQDLNCQ